MQTKKNETKEKKEQAHPASSGREAGHLFVIVVPLLFLVCASPLLSSLLVLSSLLLALALFVFEGSALVLLFC